MLGAVASSRHRRGRDGEELGRHLQQLRARAAKSPAEAAAQIGLSTDTLAYIEQDGCILRPTQLERLLEYYEAPLRDRYGALALYGSDPELNALWSGRIVRRGASLERLPQIDALRTHSVFLCHSSGDKERVQALYHRLQS